MLSFKSNASYVHIDKNLHNDIYGPCPHICVLGWHFTFKVIYFSCGFFFTIHFLMLILSKLIRGYFYLLLYLFF